MIRDFEWEHFCNRSNIAFSSRKFEHAAILCTRAALTNPSSSLAPHANGFYMQKLGKDDWAVHFYKEATILDPKNIQAYIDWSLTLSENRKHDEALAVCELSVKNNPDSGEVYQNWGVVLEEQKRYEEAIQMQIKATQLNPQDTYAYINWGVSLKHLRRYDEAIEKYQKILEIDPNYKDAYNNWGVILLYKQKYNEAAEKFKQAKQLDPMNAHYSCLNIGLCHYYQSAYKEADEEFLEGLKLFRGDKVEKERFSRIIHLEIEKIQEKQKTETDLHMLEYYKSTIEGMRRFLELLTQDQLAGK